MRVSDYVDTDKHLVKCNAHDGPQWEPAKLAAPPMDASYTYHWHLLFDCGHEITMDAKLSDFGTADNELFKILESGRLDSLAAYMVREEESQNA